MWRGPGGVDRARMRLAIKLTGTTRINGLSAMGWRVNVRVCLNVSGLHSLASLAFCDHKLSGSILLRYACLRHGSAPIWMLLSGAVSFGGGIDPSLFWCFGGRAGMVVVRFYEAACVTRSPPPAFAGAGFAGMTAMGAGIRSACVGMMMACAGMTGFVGELHGGQYARGSAKRNSRTGFPVRLSF